MSNIAVEERCEVSFSAGKLMGIILNEEILGGLMIKIWGVNLF